MHWLDSQNNLCSYVSNLVKTDYVVMKCSLSAVSVLWLRDVQCNNDIIVVLIVNSQGTGSRLKPHSLSNPSTCNSGEVKPVVVWTAMDSLGGYSISSVTSLFNNSGI